MTLYDVRHGGVTYSPVFLVGFAGLLAGSAKRNRPCVYASIFLISYVASFMWATAGESWSARYWVAGLPFVAVGICYWMQQERRWFEFIPISLLTLITIFNAALFVKQPVWYLESRFASIPYSVLFRLTGFHFGLILPVEGNPARSPMFAQTIPELLLFSGLLVILLSCNSFTGSLSVRGLASVVSSVALLCGLGLTWVTTLPEKNNSPAVSAGEEMISINLPKPEHIAAIQFDELLTRNWDAAGFPVEFSVTCFAGTRSSGSFVETALPLLLIRRCSPSDEVKIVVRPLRSDADFFHDAAKLTILQRGI